MQRIITIILIIFACWSPKASAQHNFFKIDDECYAIYLRAHHLYDDSIQFRAAIRKGIELSRKKKDAKAEIIMACEVLQFNTMHHKHKAMHDSANRVRELSQKAKLWQYFYFAYQTEIEYDYSNSHMAEGRTLMQRMRLEALHQNDVTSQWYTYKTMGFIYLHQGIQNLAEKYLNLTISLNSKLNPRQSISPSYWALAELKPDPRVRLHLYEQALSAAINEHDSIMTYANKAIAYGMLNDDSQFEENYKLFVSKNGPISPRTEQPTERALLALHEAFQGNIDKAYEICYAYRNQKVCQEVLIHISIRAKDFKRACDNFHGYIIYTKRQNEESLRNQMEELSAFFENGRLKNEMEEQELRLMQSRKRQAEIDRDNELFIADTMKLQLASSSQEIINRQLAREQHINDSRLDAEKARRERVKAEQLSEQSRHELLITSVAAVSLLIIAIIILLYAVHQRRSAKRLRRYMSALHKASIETREANEAKSKFIQNMSHEIRTPLNAVVGFSQILAVDGIPLSDEERSEYGTHIFNNAKTLNMLIDDVLNISDIESGKTVINYLPHNINQICRNVIEQSQYRLMNGVTMTYTTDIPDDYITEIDARHVQTVLLNLISNACKFTQKGSITLHSSISERPGSIAFHVIDTGIGIPEDKFEFVFKRFAKIDEFQQGAGLGLPLCRNVADALGGKVYIASSSPEGTDMAFIMPLKESQSER